MHIANNILKYYLRNVLFITGTAYAGKSTMVRMLAEKYGLIHCGENYHAEIPTEVLSLVEQPNLNYFKTMKDWQEFVNRTPEEYSKWIFESSKEAAEIEVAMLISLSQERKSHS
jgi:dephospho-CoA kinase